jgi:hypothetical protein
MKEPIHPLKNENGEVIKPMPASEVFGKKSDLMDKLINTKDLKKK